MKVIQLIVLSFCSCGVLSAATFGYITQDISNKDMFLHKGTKVELIKNENNILHVKLNSYIDNEGKLFFDKDKRLKIGILNKKSTNTPTIELEFTLESAMFSSNARSTWEEYEELYYAACTQCHSANDPTHHSMLEWEGLYGSMKEQTQLSEEESGKIMRYLKSHAKDGFVSEK